MNKVFLKKRKDYSIDLETLGTDYDSYILAIACVEFDIKTGDILRTFYMHTDCSEHNEFKIDIETVVWWLQQSDTARNEVISGYLNNKKPAHIINVLRDLNNFIIGDDDIHDDNLSINVWGNGPTFDITILEHAYKVTKLYKPIWQEGRNYRGIRDMKTLLDSASQRGFKTNSIHFEGALHCALNDAIHQARVISAAFNT